MCINRYLYLYIWYDVYTPPAARSALPPARLETESLFRCGHGVEHPEAHRQFEELQQGHSAGTLEQFGCRPPGAPWGPLGPLGAPWGPQHEY